MLPQSNLANVNECTSAVRKERRANVLSVNLLIYVRSGGWGGVVRWCAIPGRFILAPTRNAAARQHSLHFASVY